MQKLTVLKGPTPYLKGYNLLFCSVRGRRKNFVVRGYVSLGFGLSCDIGRVRLGGLRAAGVETVGECMWSSTQTLNPKTP